MYGEVRVGEVMWGRGEGRGGDVGRGEGRGGDVGRGEGIVYTIS